MKRLLSVILLLVLISPINTLAESEAVYKGLSNFTKVLDLIERNYVDKVSSEDLTNNAIEGMLKTLDPYSAYLSPERYKELEIGTSGEFGGVGMEVAVENGVLKVISPIEGSPADIAGIKPGDLITAIDGKSTRGMLVYDAVKLLRGPKGSNVTITFTREGEGSRDITLTRDVIHIKSVKYKLLEDGIGYIKVSQFQENVSDELRSALSKLEINNGGTLRGLVLDLRNNPGGLLDEAIEVTDEFIDKGLIVSVRGRASNQSKEYYATKGEPKHDFPLVVLVNKGSASASEVVAEALQDSKRATIIGSKTFGKGSVQTIIQLDDGSGLKLTTAKFYAPSGRSINDVGVTPDIIVEDDENHDMQIKRAVEILKFSDLNNTVPRG
ncbi:MAG: S41 family peptidase [Deltaproteobacteria bacterium]|nr:S41 family peptidase [Deltaproteobacteria bacterium]